MPKISSQVAERVKTNNPNIDLQTAENWLIRDELISLCKKGIDEGLLTKVRYCPFFKTHPYKVERILSLSLS